MLRAVALGDGSVVHTAFTQRADGDFADGAAPISFGPSVAHTWLRQEHGADVVVVDAPGEQCGATADAAVSGAPSVPLTIRTADCAPIALYGDDGIVAAVHAGWHGIVAGVIPACVDVMRAQGAQHVRAIVGPCIHAECYEFGPRDLDRVSAAVGADVSGTTARGEPALDLPAAVVAALQRSGVEVDEVVDECTACRPGDYYSHRARRDAARHVMMVWRTAPER
jgi:YfiH family protein